jgi:tRNA-guanine family transglycosylase
MKIFLSWSPVPPDPPYWKWLKLDGIVVSIALLKQENLLERALICGLHEFLDFHGLIFLDSGSYEDFIADKNLRPNTPEELLTLAEWLRVDLVAHSDIPYVGKNRMLPEEEKWRLLEQNILNAEIAYNWSKTHRNKPCVVYVIQGWNQESLFYCCEALAKLNASYYALGSLLGLSPEEIIKRVRLVREIIGDKPKLHLFAAANSIVLSKVKSMIDSVDSSTASISGAMKEIVTPSGRRVNMNKMHKRVDCDCPICRKHGGAIIIHGKKGTQNYYNQLRKVHNAYQLIRRLEKFR